MRSIFIFFNSLIFILLFCSNNALSNTLERIDIIGNDRISDETIKLFINVKVNDEIDNDKLNDILKDLYETDFFSDVSVSLKNQILAINVLENPIIENIVYEGVKNKKTLEIISENATVKSRSSFNENAIKSTKKY